MSLTNFTKILEPICGRAPVTIRVQDGKLIWEEPERRLRWPEHPNFERGWDKTKYRRLTHVMADWHNGRPPLFVIETLRDLPGKLIEDKSCDPL